MPAEEIIVEYVVPPGYAGLRVDVFLRARLKRISRTKVREIIENGSCSFKSGREIAPAARVDDGDVILVRREAKDEVEVPAFYRVIHDDERILVVDKPAGLPVHPTSRYLKSSLVRLIENDFGTATIHLCHRIDRETSGIVLLAKDLEGERRIKRQFAGRAVHKSYVALVAGRPAPPEGVVDVPLRKSITSRILVKMEVAGSADELGAKPAVTRYRVLGSSPRFSLVECFPETGRQHQIRIHLAHIGHGIVGDKIYGASEKLFLDFVRFGAASGAAAALPLPRHALHAASLSFVHPGTGERVAFRAELPGDMRRLFEDDLRGGGAP